MRPAIAALLLLLCAATLQPVLAATFKFTRLVQADDPRLARSKPERAVIGQPGDPVADALKVAPAEHQLELDAAGAKLDLLVVPVADAASARAAASNAEAAGAAALLDDLPPAWLLAAADAASKLPLLNVGAAADGLRQADRRRNVFHLALSERMRSDAIAQASIARVGLKLVASKSFKLSADPRARDLTNTRLLTAGSGAEYDVVWVVDSDSEFAINLPYRTALPRPVVADAGLVAVAWSPRFERYGAPQVTRRLTKVAGGPMGAYDGPGDAVLHPKDRVDTLGADAPEKLCKACS